MIKPKKALENISPYQIEEYKQEWRLKLDKNECIYGCANNILSVIKNISPDEISLYPAYGKLLDKFSEKYGLDRSNVLFTNGTSDAIKNITEAYLEDGESSVSFFEFKEENNSGNKIIYIETPDIQTGLILRASEIERLLQEHPDKLFVINSSYSNYSNIVAFEDYIDLVKKHDNVIVFKSYSNDFAIAGIRFGVIFANNLIIKNLKKVIMPYSVNSIAINCASMILNDNKRIEEIRELNNNARNLFEEILKRNEIEFYKSEANFILCNFKNCCEFYFEKFKKQGVITKKYSNESCFKDHLRITIPTLGGVKFIGELLNKKDVIMFDTKNVLFNEEKLLISKDRLNDLSVKYDLVIYSSEQDFELLEKYEIEKYFYSISLSKEMEILEFLNKIPCKTIKFFSADVNNIIKANMSNIETIGIIPAESNHQTMINNYRHLGINYIMDEIKNIEKFLNPQIEMSIE